MSRVSEFLSNYPNEDTSRNYFNGLYEFFRSTYEDPKLRASAEKLEWMNQQAERYFKETRDYEKDVEAFQVALNGKPPKTIRLRLAAVKMFLVENDSELSQKFWQKVRRRIKGSRAQTMDKIPSNLELRRIISHMPIQGKALSLTLASSGMRIGETLQLKPSDLELDKTPCKVNIRGEYTKTGNPRIAFISREATEAVEEWLKVREQYLKSAAGRSHTYDKSTEDDRLFPFESNTAYFVWRNALVKSGFAKRDASTNRHAVHPHVLRKFFRTKMGAVIPVDVAEALMGHEGYLTEVYRKYSLEDLAKFYLQGEPALSIFTEAEEVGKLRAEVEDRNKTLQTLVNGLTTENLDLRSRVAKTELENIDLKKRISKTEEKLGEIETLLKQMVQEAEK